MTLKTQLGAAIGVLAAGMAIGAPGARAAGWDELLALATCAPDDPPVTVQLDVDVSQPDDALVVSCDATIDLNGHQLTVEHIEIVPPVELIIDDTSPDADGLLNAIAREYSSTAGIGVPTGASLTVEDGNVVARGINNALDPDGAAGIGGDVDDLGVGTVRINGGTVTATGAEGGAGIGGGAGRDGGTVVINGGTVIANGARGAAGIGGGSDGDGGTIDIIGGQIAANGGAHGAGVGGGLQGEGGDIEISGGTVTAAGAEGGAGVGGGAFGGGGVITIGGGSVDATGDLQGGAGIGGGMGGNGGVVTIGGGVVDATGGLFGGAGIGGGATALGGLVTITGGSVTAFGGEQGAGIGGGAQGGGGRTDISGGTVTATGVMASGIGPGCSDPGSERLTIGAGATVTSIALEGRFCANVPAVGLGGAAPALVVAGVLRLDGGPVIVPAGGEPNVLVDAGGLITGPVATPTVGSGFTGSGSILNHGIIAFDESLVGVAVADHDHLHTFTRTVGDPGGAPIEVRVFAPTFASGYRTAPAPTAGTAWAVDDPDDPRWWWPDEPLTTDLDLYEADATIRTLAVGDPDPVVAGTPVALDTVVSDQFGPVDPQPALEYESTNATDTFTGDTLVPTVTGTRTITVTEPVSGATDTVELTVTAAPAATLELAPSATSVARGGRVTFTVTGHDEYGNPADTSGVVLSSSVATDEIDGLSVTFPTASPHVITATVGAVTASVTIEVVPPPTTTTTLPPSTTSPPPSITPPPPPTTGGPVPAPELPATGGSPAPVTLAAGVAVALGAAGALASRRRSAGRTG